MDVIKESTGRTNRPGYERNVRGMMFSEWLWGCDITHLEIKRFTTAKKRALLALWASGEMPNENYGR